MKIKWKKCIYILVCFILIVSRKLHAEELYSPYVLKWNHFIGNEAYLKVNGDGLDSWTSGYFNTIYSRWNSSPYVYAEISSFSSSTVDYTSATSDWWARNVDDPHNNVFAVTLPTDTNGLVIDGVYEASISSGKIRYALIAYTPNDNVYMNATASQIRKSMVHEMGHALGLGHVSVNAGVASIMIGGLVSYEHPQTYDYSVLANKYS